MVAGASGQQTFFVMNVRAYLESLEAVSVNSITEFQKCKDPMVTDLAKSNHDVAFVNVQWLGEW